MKTDVDKLPEKLNDEIEYIHFFLQSVHCCMNLNHNEVKIAVWIYV